MDSRKRLFVAVAVFAALAVAIWLTMDSSHFPVGVPVGKREIVYVFVPLRKAVLSVVTFLAAFSILRWKIDEHRARRDRESAQE
jgi:preprotein translocase subunit SecE